MPVLPAVRPRTKVIAGLAAVLVTVGLTSQVVGNAAEPEAAGKAPEATASATPGAPAATVAAALVEDTYVDPEAPAATHSTRASLIAGGGKVAYLKFTVAQVPAQPRLVLSLRAKNRTATQVGVFAASSAWSAGTLTARNQPGTSGPALATVTRTTRGGWVTLSADMSALIKAPGTYSLALKGIGAGARTVRFGSQESANPPRITVNGGTAASPTPRPTVTPTATPTPPPTATTPGPTPTSTATPRPSRWTPKPGVQWQWQLSSVPTAAELATAYAAGARAFDVDGDAATVASVKAIHALGSGVGAVCYIDVGGWEDYRSDAAAFPASVKGKAIDGWPSERWLDVRQLTVLKPLMQARVQMCAGKGFDAVEPDLLDGFENDTGFPITRAQQIAYNTMIAGLAHDAGMSVAQKGVASLATALEPVFDWTLNEQCGEFDECGSLTAYTKAGKAVWIVEYSGFPKACALDFPVAGAAAMFKNLDLTANPRTPCRSAQG